MKYFNVGLIGTGRMATEHFKTLKYLAPALLSNGYNKATFLPIILSRRVK